MQVVRSLKGFWYLTVDGNHNGEITFGKADASKLDSTTTQVSLGLCVRGKAGWLVMQTLPVLESATSWEVEMGAVTVNGKEVVSGGNVTLSTGMTHMLITE